MSRRLQWVALFWDQVKHFSGAGWLMAEKLTRVTVGAIIGVLLARSLGPDEYGLLSFAVGFVSIFASIGSLGLESVLVKNIVERRQEAAELLGTAFFLRIVAAIFALTLVFFALFSSAAFREAWPLVVIISLSYFFQSTLVIEQYFQSKSEFRLISILNVISLSIFLILNIILLAMEAALIWFAVAILLDHITRSFLFLSFNQFRGIRVNQWKSKILTAKELISESWPLILSGFVLMLQARVDQVMLKEMVGSSSVGQYSVALRVIEAFAFIPMAIRTAALPFLVELRAKSRNLYRDRIQSLYRIIALVGALNVVPLFWLGPDLVSFIFGAAYAEAASLIPLFAVRLFLAYFGVMRSMHFLIEKRNQYMLLTMIIATVLNIVLNLIYIPLDGAIGAVWAMIVSFVVATFVADFLCRTGRDHLFLVLSAFLKLSNRRRDRDRSAKGSI